MDIPLIVKQLVEKRDKARAEGNFLLSDSLREQIMAEGFMIEDTKEGSVIRKLPSSPSFLTVFGSGEISSVGRQIHEYVLTQLGKKEIQIGILTTPAGFQPNVITVHEEIKDFFEEHLTNFHPRVKIIYANTKEDANNSQLVHELDECDYIFMGPGSPTYAIVQLRDSLLFSKIREKVCEGASLCLSSAAALAFSKVCLPVYEIYKVGASLHWIDGLNFYEEFLHETLTVIPHFNNTEGGSKNDTSRCYMGEKRFNSLLSLLPSKTAMIGIDEQTAKVWDLSNKKSIVLGKGTAEYIS